MAEHAVSVVQCRACSHSVRRRAASCPLCGIGSPGRRAGAAFTAWSVVLFVILVSATLFLYFTRGSIQLGISLVAAAAIPALLRAVLPMMVPAPKPKQHSLVSRIEALDSRVADIGHQLKSLADAYDLARKRTRSRLMETAMSRLKRSYTVLRKYRDRFDAQLVHLQFSLWLHETAAIVDGWEEADTRTLSVVYSRLVQRADVCRVRFEEVISGKKTQGPYRAAGAAVRDGLRRVDIVADAMVARKAQFALAAVSPASLPVDSHYESLIDDLPTHDLVCAAEALEQEYDRIIAEHELS